MINGMFPSTGTGAVSIVLSALKAIWFRETLCKGQISQPTGVGIIGKRCNKISSMHNQKSTLDLCDCIQSYCHTLQMILLGYHP